MSDDIKVKVTVVGNDKVSAAIRAKVKAILEDGKTAIYEGGELVGTAIQSEAPVDTGEMKASVAVDRVSDTEVRVGPHTEYAKWVENGHHGWSGDPFVRRGVEKSRSQVANYIKGRLSK